MSDANTATVEPDHGLPGPFLTEAARRLEEHGVTAAYDFPGILRFAAGGRTWTTGYTGLHVGDDEGHGDQLHGDEHLTALEHVGELSIERYVAVLLGVIAAADAAHAYSATAGPLQPEYRVAKQYEGSYYILNRDGERAAKVAKFMPGPMVSVEGQGGIYSPALARAIARAMNRLANEIEKR